MGSFHGIRELHSGTVHLSMRTFGVSHEYLLGFLKGTCVPPCKEVTLSKRTPQIHSVSVLLRHGNGQRGASTTFAHHSIYTVQRKPIVTLGTTQIVILLVVLGGTKQGEVDTLQRRNTSVQVSFLDLRSSIPWVI